MEEESDITVEFLTKFLKATNIALRDMIKEEKAKKRPRQFGFG